MLSPPQRAQETHTTAVFPFLFCSDRQRDIPPTSSDCSPDPTAAAAAMSWDDHLNALKGHGLTHAAICDNKAASWITVSDGCNVSVLERISLAILAHLPHFWHTRVWRSSLKVYHFVTCFRACKSDEQGGRERRGHASLP